MDGFYNNAILLFALGIPLFGWIALIWGLIWTAWQFYNAWKGQRVNALSRIVNGQERLTNVVWRWGIIGYPIFALVVGSVLLVGLNILRGGFMAEGGGPDMSREKFACWEILACYRIVWSAAIIRCAHNTEKKAYSATAMVVAGIIVLLVVIKIPEMISLHTQVETFWLCKKSQHLAPGGILEPVCAHGAIDACRVETLCVW